MFSPSLISFWDLFTVYLNYLLHIKLWSATFLNLEFSPTTIFLWSSVPLYFKRAFPVCCSVMWLFSAQSSIYKLCLSTASTVSTFSYAHNQDQCTVLLFWISWVFRQTFICIQFPLAHANKQSPLLLLWYLPLYTSINDSPTCL